MTADLVRELKDEAAAVGFDVAGITRVDPSWNAADRLDAFLAEGRHGTMTWMATERRRHPAAMWAEAKSALVVGKNYGPDLDPLAALERRDRAAISVYAQGDDYHDVLKKRLKQLGRAFAERHRCEVRVFVDTAPLMEKPLAERAGAGWQGKHTNLVSREFGSWLFLGVLLTDLDLEPDAPGEDHCGACRACLDICPTSAFPAPYQLDARRCLSYLTIEHKGPVPLEFREAMGNRIYGCDDCLAVCPWNKFASTAQEAALQARDALKSPSLKELAALDDAAFRALFRKSPIKRIGRDRFIRNVMIAIGNSKKPELAAAAEARLDDASPLVRGAAVWALGRLVSADSFARLRARCSDSETDADVRAEWARA